LLLLFRFVGLFDELQIFLVRVALFAGLPLMMRGNAALMSALFAFGGGLFATGLLMFCRERQSRQKDCRANRSNESFDGFHGI
jgi:hypothetical protein